MTNNDGLMVIWAVATVAMLLVAILAPGVRDLFKVAPLSAAEWMFVLMAASIGTFWIDAEEAPDGRHRSRPSVSRADVPSSLRLKTFAKRERRP